MDVPYREIEMGPVGNRLPSGAVTASSFQRTCPDLQFLPAWETFVTFA